MKLPIGDIVQKCRQLDDEHIRGRAVGEAFRHFSNAMRRPPIMARTLLG